MSIAISQPVADVTTSAFDQVKQGVVDVANWLGRQVTWIAGSIKDFALKVVEAVKPIFAAIFGFIRDQAIRVKDFVVANQHLTLGVGGVIAGLALITFFAVKYMNKSETPADNKDGKVADAGQNPAPAQGAPANNPPVVDNKK